MGTLAVTGGTRTSSSVRALHVRPELVLLAIILLVFAAAFGVVEAMTETGGTGHGTSVSPLSSPSQSSISVPAQAISGSLPGLAKSPSAKRASKPAPATTFTTPGPGLTSPATALAKPLIPAVNGPPKEPAASKEPSKSSTTKIVTGSG